MAEFLVIGNLSTYLALAARVSLVGLVNQRRRIVTTKSYNAFFLHCEIFLNSRISPILFEPMKQHGTS